MKKARVVYLLGAGASQACAQHGNASQGILMKDLGPAMDRAVGDLSRSKPEYESLQDLVNDIIFPSTDYEQIITFLDESPSAIHRRFADELRSTFHEVLRKRLEHVAQELEAKHFQLYSALLAMHRLPSFPEQMGGLLTINYDDYLDRAIREVFATAADYGIHIEGAGIPAGDAPKLLKLHGSFSWRDTWPVAITENNPTPLWIPPGIHKTKTRYPFNYLWALARELLNCDILRVVGCSLSPRDWDLISLLFTTVHSHSAGRRYTIEVVDYPRHAEDLKKKYHYLPLKSIFEIETLQSGARLFYERPEAPMNEYSEPPDPISGLSVNERKAVFEGCRREENWFALWLQQMAEILWISYPDEVNSKGRQMLEMMEQMR